MQPFASSVLFYAVLVAPGFVTVFTAISLAAVERDHSEFTLLVWSLVMSLLIDTAFLAAYQWAYGRVSSVNEFPAIFFEPYFHFEYVVYIFSTSFVIGVIGAGGLLLEVPNRLRRGLQTKSQMAVNPRQPWANFLRDTDEVQVWTSDEQYYRGFVIEWSRAGRPRQLRIFDPYRYEPETDSWVPAGPEEMLFMEDDIQRVMMLEMDVRPTLWQRLIRFVTQWGENNTAENEDDEYNSSTGQDMDEMCDETHRIDFDTLLEKVEEGDTQVALVQNTDSSDSTVTMKVTSTGRNNRAFVFGFINTSIIAIICIVIFYRFPDLALPLIIGALGGIFGDIGSVYLRIQHFLSEFP